MKEPSSARIGVDEFIERYPAETQEIIQAARAVVRRVAPKADERAYRSWPMRFNLGPRMIAALGAYKEHVNLYLDRGAELDDPDGLLEGTGRGMRHVKLRSVADAKRPAVRRLLEQALRQG